MEPQLTLRDELKSKHYWKALRAEFIASFLLSLFTSSMAAQNSAATASMAMGLSLALNMYLFGAQSGGLGMPTLALSLYTLRHITALRCVSFSLVQLLGTMLACGINYGLNSNSTLNFGGPNSTTSIHSKNAVVWVQPQSQQVDLSIGRIFGFEFFGNFLVVLAVCHAWSAFKHYDDPNRQALQFFNCRGQSGIGGCGGLESNNNMVCAAPLYTGLMGVGAVCFAFDATGAILNPYRALWQAIFTDHWHHHWIYWVAAVLASIFGAFTHDYLRTSPIPTRKHHEHHQPSTEQHSPKHHQSNHLRPETTQLTSISAFQHAVARHGQQFTDNNNIAFENGQLVNHRYADNVTTPTFTSPPRDVTNWNEYVTVTELQDVNSRRARHPYNHLTDTGQTPATEDDDDDNEDEDDTEDDTINQHQTYRQYTSSGGRRPMPRSHDTEITLLTTPVETPNTDDNNTNSRQHDAAAVAINSNRNIVTSAASGFLDSSV